MPPARQPVAGAALLAAVGALGAYQVVALVEPGDLEEAAVAFLFSWLLCLALLANRARGGIYSPPAAYLVIFGLFHGGLLLSFSLRSETGLPGAEIRWLLGDRAPVAAALATIGMIAFAISADLASSGRCPRFEVTTAARDRRTLGLLGLGVQFVGLAIFAKVILSGGGFALLQSGYQAYQKAVQGDGLLSYGILALGVGPVLAIAAGGRARRRAWWLFGIYAFFAFPLGLRGEVLFPLVAMVVVEVRRGRRVRALWTGAGALLVMTLIGAVRETRANGVGALLDLSSLASPLDAAAEMGYSLRPTVMVLGWHDRGEPFRNGETLLVVPIRAVEKLLGSGGGPPAYDDRLFNVEILHRVGPVGGSPVAEAYHNFGTAGVVGVMAFLGVVIGLLTRIDRTPWNDALLGALLMIFLIQVRNSFAPVPVQIVLVVGLLRLARLSARSGAGSPRVGGGGEP